MLTNATILTMDEDRPRAESLAIRGDRIVAIGSRAEVGLWIGPGTRVANMHGRTVIPGLNDTHIHAINLGFEKNTAVGLTDTANVEDIQAMLAARLQQLRDLRPDDEQRWGIIHLYQPTPG